MFDEGLFFIKWFLLVMGGVVIVIILLVLLCYYCWKIYICFSKNVGEFFNSCIIFYRMLFLGFLVIYIIYFLIECYNMKIVKSLINKLILFMIIIYFCYGLYILFFFYRIVFIFKGFFDIFE